MIGPHAPTCSTHNSGANAVILQRLKLATHARHVYIESRSVLLDPQLSLPTYRDLLARFLGYYGPLEAQVRRSLAGDGVAFEYAERYKSRQLEQDLFALGVTPDAVAELAQCVALPDLATPAQLLGCLYVLEGATLGGQIITKHLAANLRLTPQQGGAFFSGYGERTGSRWKEFCGHLTAFAERSDCDLEIVESANATFDSLDGWLYPTTKPSHYDRAEQR